MFMSILWAVCVEFLVEFDVLIWIFIFDLISGFFVDVEVMRMAFELARRQ